MFSKYRSCKKCGHDILMLHESGIKLLEELQTKDSVTLIGEKYGALEGGTDNFDKYKDFIRGELRRICTYCGSDLDKLLGFMREHMGKTFTCFKATEEIWFALAATAVNGFDYISSEMEDDYKLCHLTKCPVKVINSLTIKRGEKYDEWYNEWKVCDKYIEIAPYRRSMCPHCGGIDTLSEDNWLSDEEWKPIVNDEITKYINECEKELTVPLNKKEIIASTDIVSYLEHLVAVENNIRFFSMQYCEHVQGVIECQDGVEREKRRTKVERSVIAKNSSDEIEELNSRLQELDVQIDKENAMLEDKLALAKKYNVAYPQNIRCPLHEPVVSKPLYPTLKQAGLFNKSKVKQENEMLLATYNRELDRYNSVWQEYREAVQRYEENEKIREAFEEQYCDLQMKQQQEINNLNAKREELISEKLVEERKLEERAAEEEMIIDTLLTQSEEHKFLVFYQEELEETKSILKQLINCKMQLHSLDVIFPKYLEYVSVVTILEYFQSGRCSELTGADGAYNLYENELRQNIIIGKLDDIVERLDDIKSNQYLIYTSLESINNGINLLNETFEKAVDTMENIEETTLSIKEHTAMTAYYSAKTAEYTKRNAELTNALGYLVAFK